MQQIKLRFRSLMELWAFKTFSGVTNVEVNFSDVTLLCVCSDEQVKVAVKAFEAKVEEVSTAS